MCVCVCVCVCVCARARVDGWVHVYAVAKVLVLGSVGRAHVP